MTDPLPAAPVPPDRPPDVSDSAPVASPADPLAGLRERITEAALGELSAGDLAALQADLAAHPDREALAAAQGRLEKLLVSTAANPALQPLQPRESWRAQTLHKAKVEAARLRKNRTGKAMPVARPPVSHRQLAGLTPQSLSAHPDLEINLAPLSAGASSAAVAETNAIGVAGMPAFLTNDRQNFDRRQSVRRLFWVVVGVGLLGVFVMLVIFVRVMQHWQAQERLAAGAQMAPPAATNLPGALTPSPRPGLGEKPLTSLELLTLKSKFNDLTLVIHAGAAAITLERSGALTASTWPRVAGAPAAGSAHLDPDCDRYMNPLSPSGWEHLELEGDVRSLAWVYVPDDPRGLMLVLRPKPPAAQAEPPTAAGNATVPAIGWELEVRKNQTQLALFDIPAPPGAAGQRLEALAIERIALANDQEELRFKALTVLPAASVPAPAAPAAESPAPPAPAMPDAPAVAPTLPASPPAAEDIPKPATDAIDPAGPAPSSGPQTEWSVLSERILPVKTGPGHWAVELPKNQPLPPGLTYTIHQSVPRQSAAPANP
ncbi:MAG TPA: hypothetical protein VL860_00170 [Planctomycetota bacterium]|nr:hypothetical protein [Planctomycetota bacterium]